MIICIGNFLMAGTLGPAPPPPSPRSPPPGERQQRQSRSTQLSSSSFRSPSHLQSRGRDKLERPLQLPQYRHPHSSCPLKATLSVSAGQGVDSPGGCVAQCLVNLTTLAVVGGGGGGGRGGQWGSIFNFLYMCCSFSLQCPVLSLTVMTCSALPSR